MSFNELVTYLHSQCGFETKSEIADYLGISRQTLNNWQSKDIPLNPVNVVNLIDSAKEASEYCTCSEAISPIVEFYGIELEESKQGSYWEIFDENASCNPRQKTIKQALKSSRGVYIFYDSRGKALYVGRTENNNLWNEMKYAFNREMSDNIIRCVFHPSQGESYGIEHESDRLIQNFSFPLSELACYFSAYKIHDYLISTIEALLIRAFANNLINSRIEKFHI